MRLGTPLQVYQPTPLTLENPHAPTAPALAPQYMRASLPWVDDNADSISQMADFFCAALETPDARHPGCTQPAGAVADLTGAVSGAWLAFKRFEDGEKAAAFLAGFRAAARGASLLLRVVSHENSPARLMVEGAKTLADNADTAYSAQTAGIGLQGRFGALPGCVYPVGYAAPAAARATAFAPGKS